MSLPYICSTCRLSRYVLRLRLERAGRRQCLSQSTGLRQDLDQRQAVPAGRYSGKSLQSQHLHVDQITDEKRLLSNDFGDLSSVRHDNISEGDTGQLDNTVPLHVRKTLKRINEWSRNPDRWAMRTQIFDHLFRLKSATAEGHISSTQFDAVIRTFRSHSEALQWACSDLVNVHVRYLQGRPRTIPQSVANVVKLLQDLSLINGPIWRIMLDQYSRNIAAARALHRTWDEKNGGEVAAIEDLMAVWELRIRAGLNRDEKAPHRDDVDLSMLPGPESIRSLRQRLRLPFQQAFEMYVPVVAVETLPPRKSQGILLELSASALLTHYLLTTAPDANLPTSPYGELEAFRPFTQFMSALLDPMDAKLPAVVPWNLGSLMLATVGREEDSKMYQYFADMVQKLGLKKSPELRNLTARGRNNRRTPDEATNEPQPEADEDTSLHPQPLSESVFEVDTVPGSGGDVRTSDPGTRFANTAYKRLGRAVERQHTGQVELALSELETMQKSVAVPQKVYEHLIYASIALQKPDITVKAWKLMGNAKLTSTVQTWTVIMKGCQRARDVDGLENAWKALRSHGLQPDSQAWRTRIFGLIMGKKVDEGLRALDEMTKDYAKAAKEAQLGIHSGPSRKALRSNKRDRHVEESTLDLAGLPDDINSVPRPDLAIMNAAISALAITADEHIAKVLSWGVRLGIEPDSNTYNAFLNVCIRHHETEQGLDILKQMQAKGIKPDSQTFSILLTGLFHADFLRDASEQEQEEKILALIDTVEKAGAAQLDQKGYALIIDRLLKLYSNISAARRVMERMEERGVQVSNHIYTILLTHYFAQEPPDVAAVDGLWEHLQTTSDGFGTPMDSVLYDRLIEGYARHHEQFGTSPMLKVLFRMSQEGKSPSWPALETVARALAARGEWDRLTGIVQDVRHGRAMSVKISDRTGQESFWFFIISTGILAEEDITHPRQIRIHGQRHLGAHLDAGVRKVTSPIPV